MITDEIDYLNGELNKDFGVPWDAERWYWIDVVKYLDDGGIYEYEASLVKGSEVADLNEGLDVPIYAMMTACSDFNSEPVTAIWFFKAAAP